MRYDILIADILVVLITMVQLYKIYLNIDRIELKKTTLIKDTVILCILIIDLLVLGDNNITTIEDFFTKAKYENNDVVIKLQNGSEVVPVHNHNTLSYKDHDYKTIERPINYIMRHKVTKDKFRLKTKSGKELIVTGDHSIMVIRNNELVSLPAREIKKSDKIITLDR